MQQQIHYCEACNQQVDFNREQDFILRDETLHILGEAIILNDVKVPVCPICKDDISDDVLDTKQLQDAIEQYEKQTGKVYKDQFPRGNKQ